jgi:protein ImuB
VAGAAADEAVAVLHANRVVAMSRRAAADGIAVGQRRRDAQARSPHVRIVAHDPMREARAFDRVTQAIGALIPRVEVTEPGTLTFVARGPARFYGGEETMLARMIHEIVTTIEGFGSTSAVGSASAVGSIGAGIADGRFAATVAARRSAHTGTPCTVAAGVVATAAFLAPLSVRVLGDVAGLAPDVVDLLQRLGVQRLGDLAALPTPDVVARFGHAGAFAQRIASGGDDRLPGTLEPPPGSAVQRDFDDPVHHSDIVVFAARQLADELTGSMAARGRVVTRLVVTLQTDHGEHSERVWYRSTGLNAAAVVERVRWQLDAWAQQAVVTAGVVMVRLEPAEVRSDDGVQLGLWGGRTQADEWATRAVARLVAVAGEQQVLVPAGAGGRQPADAYRLVPAATADLADPAERLRPPLGPWPGQLPSPSPTVVHEQPIAIAVVDAAGAAVQVTGRGAISGSPARVTVGGTTHAVAAWAGPWPVDERWWDTARARRLARFQLLTDSGRLLLAAVEHQQWWLSGEYR